MKDKLYVEADTALDLSAVSFPEYDCPECGTVTSIIDVTIPGLEGTFCQHCFVKNVVMPNCEKVTPKNKE